MSISTEFAVPLQRHEILGNICAVWGGVDPKGEAAI
jgi:hypothetical protein